MHVEQKVNKTKKAEKKQRRCLVFLICSYFTLVWQLHFVQFCWPATLQSLMLWKQSEMIKSCPN